MSINPENEQEFLKFAADYVEMVQQTEPGTMLYVLTKHPSEPQTYVWLERYRGQEALKLHSERPEMAEAMGTLPNWWSRPPELLPLRQVIPG